MTVSNAELLQVAKEVCESAPAWADLSNALFDQEHGILAKSFKSSEERAQFVKSDEYRQIKQLIRKAQERSGLVAGATPTKSGKMLVRLPVSMHEALEYEAEAEGVSLNQLVVAKLALQFSRIRESGKQNWAPLVIQAFLETRGGTSDGVAASEDRVIADPDLNARYLLRCKELGATLSDVDLNKKLMQVRKTGQTTHLPKVQRFHVPRSRVDLYQHAAEMALRFVQKKEMEQSWREVSLDTIICDPLLAAAFDSFASRLAPGYTPFEYRWAALSLRKAGRYMKEAMQLDLPFFKDLGRTSKLDLDQLPDSQGLYLVHNRNERVFVGETQHLRSRIKLHFEVAGERMVPSWLYGGCENETRLSIASLPEMADAALKAAELRAILAFSPILNFARTAAA